MVYTKIRLIILFVAEEEAALYSQDLELTTTQVMSSLLKNSGLNGRK